MNITIETIVQAPIDKVWRAYTSPEDIIQWNAASDDWHTTSSSVELRVGGTVSSRMEAKDGSFGFDFAGTYTKIIPNELIEYEFFNRSASVEFMQIKEGVKVRITFIAETEHSVEDQEEGWQAILDKFARHVEGKK
ncbi:MAG: hypothetical protein RIS60_876 [Pseudomonadota bacterium]